MLERHGGGGISLNGGIRAPHRPGLDVPAAASCSPEAGRLSFVRCPPFRHPRVDRQQGSWRKRCAVRPGLSCRLARAGRKASKPPPSPTPARHAGPRQRLSTQALEGGKPAEAPGPQAGGQDEAGREGEEPRDARGIAVLHLGQPAGEQCIPDRGQQHHGAKAKYRAVAPPDPHAGEQAGQAEPSHRDMQGLEGLHIVGSAGRAAGGTASKVASSRGKNRRDQRPRPVILRAKACSDSPVCTAPNCSRPLRRKGGQNADRIMRDGAVDDAAGLSIPGLMAAGASHIAGRFQSIDGAAGADLLSMVADPVMLGRAGLLQVGEWPCRRRTSGSARMMLP